MSSPPVPITVRRPRFDFAELPRAWIAGSRLATHFGNAGHVFIPLGEQFFIDTVKEFRGSITDPVLREAVNAFIGQESVHKRAHEDIWATLRAHGVPVDAYARCIEAVRGLESRLPARFRLSVTAALEHYTAAFGHAFLTENLASAVPDEMARLLAWHGLEELEHRAVAFDVLDAAGGGYVLRLAGFAMATGLLVVVPGIGTVLFAVADLARPDVEPDPEPDPVPETTGHPRSRRDLGAMAGRLARRMGGHLVDYLAPSFHPRDMEVPPEAATWAAVIAGPELDWSG